MLIVQKFGGSSLAGAEGLHRAASIILETRKRGDSVIAVVSAVGDTTDKLLKTAGDINPRLPEREAAALLSCGEQQSAALLAMMLEALGAPAVSLTGWQAGIITGSGYTDADIELCLPVRAARALSEGKIPVAAGFQGINVRGDISTLGRGGSDTTAVALAAALEAERCEIYTDVAGVYTADPGIIKNARRLEKMDYRDMLTLARSGSRVLSPKAAELAMERQVDTVLLSSFGERGRTQLCSLEDSARPNFAGAAVNKKSSELSLVGKACSGEVLSELVLSLAAEGMEAKSAQWGSGYVRVRLEEEKLTDGLCFIHRRYLEAPKAKK
ncbi:MAG: aspartate kinase [Candidatus Limivicinus sp.]|jgi:aspartate kinase